MKFSDLNSLIFLQTETIFLTKAQLKEGPQIMIFPECLVQTVNSFPLLHMSFLYLLGLDWLLSDYVFPYLL